jgi:hypothetical protein
VCLTVCKAYLRGCQGVERGGADRQVERHVSASCDGPRGGTSHPIPPPIGCPISPGVIFPRDL